MSYEDTREEVRAFLVICQQEVQDRFERHSNLFSGDVRCKIMEIADNDPSMNRLFLFYHSISLENLVLQIGKLHDPNPKNFTIESIWKKSMNYCSRIKSDLNFSNSEMKRKKDNFEKIKDKLDYFHECHIKAPRNNILAHNNPEISCNYHLPSNDIMNAQYLKKLAELSDILSEIWGINKIENAGHDVKEEIEAFCKLLKSL